MAKSKAVSSPVFHRNRTEREPRQFGCMEQFHDMLEVDVRGLAAERKLNWDIKRCAARESGSVGNVLEFTERVAEDEARTGRPVGIATVWRRCVEMQTADMFADVLATTQGKRLLKQTIRWFPKWARIAGVDSVSKLETTQDRPVLGELGKLEKVPSGHPAPLGGMSDEMVQVQADTYKKAWELTPKNIINDDIGVFGQIPEMVLRACDRSLDDLLAAKFKTPGNAYDSVAFYHATAWPTGHANLATTALTLTQAGMNLLLAGRQAMALQKDVARMQTLGIEPVALVHPIQLNSISNGLCKNDLVQIGTSTTSVDNQFRDYNVEPIEWPALSDQDTNDYYLIADPALYPAFKMLFLNGRVMPTIRTGWDTGGVVLRDGYVDADGYPLYPVRTEVTFHYGVGAFFPQAIYAFQVSGGS